MIDWIDDHPYLFVNKLSWPVIALGCLPAPRQRPMLLAGLVLIPFAVLAPLHADCWTPSYFWPPMHLSGGLTGVEDVRAFLVVGCLVWLFGAWPVRHALVAHFRLVPFLRRVLPFALAMLVVMFVLKALSLGTMPAMPVIQTALLIWLLVEMRGYRRLGLIRAAGIQDGALKIGSSKSMNPT